MTFIPSNSRYRNFEFSEGDSDDVGTNTWDCPTCVRSMPPLTNAKKGDEVECGNCGARMEIVYESMAIPRTTIRMTRQGDEGGLYFVIGGMRLKF